MQQQMINQNLHLFNINFNMKQNHEAFTTLFPNGVGFNSPYETINNLDIKECFDGDLHNEKRSNIDNIDARKTKSKEAARTRRNEENVEFGRLAKLLPLQEDISKHLDKASIIRLTISYFKLRSFMDQSKMLATTKLTNASSSKSYRYALGKCDLSQSATNCLECVLFLLGNDTKFLYISESVSQLLGLSQVGVIGTSIFEYVHEDDRCELAQNLQIKNFQQYKHSFNECHSPNSFELDLNNKKLFEEKIVMESPKAYTDPVTCTIRFKSVVLKKIANSKQSGWRCLQLCGRHARMKSDQKSILGFCGTAMLIDTSDLTGETSLRENTFVMRLNHNFKIEYIEKTDLLPTFDFDNATGKSFFDFVNNHDLENIRNQLSSLKRKELCSFIYRFGHNNGTNEYIHCKCTMITSSFNSTNDLNKSPVTPNEEIKFFVKNEVFYSNDNYSVYNRNEERCELKATYKNKPLTQHAVTKLVKPCDQVSSSSNNCTIMDLNNNYELNNHNNLENKKQTPTKNENKPKNDTNTKKIAKPAHKKHQNKKQLKGAVERLYENNTNITTQNQSGLKFNKTYGGNIINNNNSLSDIDYTKLISDNTFNSNGDMLQKIQKPCSLENLNPILQHSYIGDKKPYQASNNNLDLMNQFPANECSSYNLNYVDLNITNTNNVSASTAATNYHHQMGPNYDYYSSTFTPQYCNNINQAIPITIYNDTTSDLQAYCNKFNESQHFNLNL